MRSTLGAMTLALGAALLCAAPAVAQATHVVQLVVDAGKDEYSFKPATVSARPNDVIVFRVVSGAPHSIVFEGQGLSPGVRGAFNTAMVGRSGDLSSPLLTAVGKEYRVVVPQVPAGSYPFYCLPHRAYDMRGMLIVR